VPTLEANQREVLRMCSHEPPCPPATACDSSAARAAARHPEQGWTLLCNGVVVFDDGGALLPDGAVLPPDPAFVAA
jgi:hypothetical protein